MKKKLIAILLVATILGGTATTYYLNKNSKINISTYEEDNERDENISDAQIDESTNISNQDNIKNKNSINNKEIVNDEGNEKNEKDSIDSKDKIENAVIQREQQSVPSYEVPVVTQPNSSEFMYMVEQRIFQKVNEERSKAGVQQLTYNKTMEKYARIKSKDMGDNEYFDHADLQGNLITNKMKSDGVSYLAWAENIAYISGVLDTESVANQFMTNWMNSKGHRENILSANFNGVGVGVYKIGNTVYATQEFYK